MIMIWNIDIAINQTTDFLRLKSEVEKNRYILNSITEILAREPDIFFNSWKQYSSICNRYLSNERTIFSILYFHTEFYNRHKVEISEDILHKYTRIQRATLYQLKCYFL